MDHDENYMDDEAYEQAGAEYHYEATGYDATHDDQVNAQQAQAQRGNGILDDSPRESRKERRRREAMERQAQEEALAAAAGSQPGHESNSEATEPNATASESKPGFLGRLFKKKEKSAAPPPEAEAAEPQPIPKKGKSAAVQSVTLPCNALIDPNALREFGIDPNTLASMGLDPSTLAHFEPEFLTELGINPNIVLEILNRQNSGTDEPAEEPKKARRKFDHSPKAWMNRVKLAKKWAPAAAALGGLSTTGSIWFLSDDASNKPVPEVKSAQLAGSEAESALNKAIEKADTDSAVAGASATEPEIVKTADSASPPAIDSAPPLPETTKTEPVQVALADMPDLPALPVDANAAPPVAQAVDAEKPPGSIDLPSESPPVADSAPPVPTDAPPIPAAVANDEKSKDGKAASGIAKGAAIAIGAGTAAGLGAAAIAADSIADNHGKSASVSDNKSAKGLEAPPDLPPIGTAEKAPELPGLPTPDSAPAVPESLSADAKAASAGIAAGLALPKDAPMADLPAMPALPPSENQIPANPAPESNQPDLPGLPPLAGGNEKPPVDPAMPALPSAAEKAAEPGLPAPPVDVANSTEPKLPDPPADLKQAPAADAPPVASTADDKGKAGAAVAGLGVGLGAAAIGKALTDQPADGKVGADKPAMTDLSASDLPPLAKGTAEAPAGKPPIEGMSAATEPVIPNEAQPSRQAPKLAGDDPQSLQTGNASTLAQNSAGGAEMQTDAANKAGVPLAKADWMKIPNGRGRVLRSIGTAGKSIASAGTTAVAAGVGAGAGVMIASAIDNDGRESKVVVQQAPDQGTVDIAPISHVVQSGENFWTISRDYYGSGRYYKALWAANVDKVAKIDELHVGDSIRIPAMENLDKSLIDTPGVAKNRRSRSGENNVPDVARSVDNRAVRTGNTIESTPIEADGEPNRKSPVNRKTPNERPPVNTQPDETPNGKEIISQPLGETTAKGDYVRHRIMPGETLRTIARDRLGNARRDEEIVALNPDQLDDKRTPLVPGQILKLPKDATEDQ